jgi:hypothetical protein
LAEEFAAPYFVFRDAGVDLTLASRAASHRSIPSATFRKTSPAMARFKKDPTGRRPLPRAAAQRRSVQGARIFSAGREAGGLVGNPSLPGPYMIRVKLPMGTS